MDNRNRIRCPMCDAWYDLTDPEQARVHDHPEPQSGPMRDSWLLSGLDFEAWMETTDAGRDWHCKLILDGRR